MRIGMRAKELMRLLSAADPDAIVVVPEGDHGMREVRCEVGTVLREARDQYTEDFGEKLTPEAECGKRVPAVIVGR